MGDYPLLTLSVHAREGYSSLSVSHFFILEKAPFSGFKLTSVQSGDDLSPLNVENRSYFGEKAGGTSAVTAVIYARPVI